ncbi:hypothetical protein P7K49_019534 [Saguinus oedipus]|uniref:Collagen alpha-1(I) chain-like n=1 Tax=Saguinus oedipus TaxID=9490 RepID=A0ABQ9UXN5_SAGOE|nr:hypothetical protein P7K49_019534 [Saguinus oedipus]
MRKDRRKAARRKFLGRGAQGWAGSGGEVRGPRHESSFVAAALGSPKFTRAASRRGHRPGAWGCSDLDPSSPGVRTLQVRVRLPGAPPAPTAQAARGLGLTVWAAAAALLARRGGRAMGEGGPVPTPLRVAPAPSPGEACSWRTALSPPRPGSHVREETKEGQGGESHPDPPTPLGSHTALPAKDEGRDRGSKNGPSGHGSAVHTHGQGAGSCKVRSGAGARVRDPAGEPGRAGACGPYFQEASGREVAWTAEQGATATPSPGQCRAGRQAWTVPAWTPGGQKPGRALGSPRRGLGVCAQPCAEPGASDVRPGAPPGGAADFVRGPAGSDRQRHRGCPGPAGVGGRRGGTASLPVG